ncbi:MAG: class I SAM-dependent methyltransferase [Gammaproteobacteria bacterium]|nr:class I SAM-dependent methyltransferase [Gammaproteobacteria bacterium]
MKIESPIDRLLRKFRTNLVIPHITSNTLLCDIGCGANPTLLKQLSNTTINKSVGLDLLVPNNSFNNIELRKADFTQLPLPIKNGEFDLITMLAVLEHLDNYNEIINECFRGLKPRGKLLLTTPAPISKPLLELLANLRIISYTAIYDHKKYFNKHEIFDLLQNHGFTDIKVKSVAWGLNTVAIAIKP